MGTVLRAPGDRDTVIDGIRAFGVVAFLEAPSYADKIQSLDMEFFDSGGIERYEWSREFKDRVNSAVDAVRVQHGEPGKMLALWLLYHTVGSFVLNVLPSRDSKLVFKLLIVRPLHSMPRYAFSFAGLQSGKNRLRGSLEAHFNHLTSRGNRISN